MSLYDILGVNEDAEPNEIKKAYRRKASKAHPDRHGGNPDKKTEFQEIQRAYTILSCSESRARYDATGEDEIPLDDTEARASTIIMAVFQKLLQENELAERDYPKLIANHLTNELLNVGKSKKEMKRVLEKIQRLMPTIETDAEDNLLANMLKAETKKIEMSMAEADNQISIIERALSMLEIYRFTGSEVPADTLTS